MAKTTQQYVSNNEQAAINAAQQKARGLGSSVGSITNNGVYADRAEADAVGAAQQKAEANKQAAVGVQAERALKSAETEARYQNNLAAYGKTENGYPTSLSGNGAAGATAPNKSSNTNGAAQIDDGIKNNSIGNEIRNNPSPSPSPYNYYPYNNYGAVQDTGTAEEPADAEPVKSLEEQLREEWEAAGNVTRQLVEGARPEDISLDEINRIDVADLESKLEQIRQIQEQQAQAQTDYAVTQGVNDINRAVEDAAQNYQTQRNQISADEQRALDDQALYAEARGDRGGIGAAQYAAIQNTAATNRYRVNQEQTQLSTDAARQIADLRAQGEFEKADALLKISQNYLSELSALEEWALQTNLSVDEFNSQLQQWKANYDMSARQYMLNAEMSAAQLTGAFSDGTPTMAARDKAEQQFASAAATLYQLGIPLTDEQIRALGWSKGQYNQLENERRMANAAASYRGGTSYDQRGLTPQEIAEMQQEINANYGANIAVDGVIGPETDKWIMQAQNDGYID